MTDDQKITKIRDDIPFLRKGIYLDSASVTPMSTRVRSASDRFNAITSENLSESKALATECYDRGRMLAARLVGTSQENIAYVQNTSHGLSLVALGISWQAGDNLVVCSEEFPSNYLCWLQLAEKGVEIRRISTTNGRLEVDAIRQAMDERTRVVAVSHVQFHSGFRVDIAALGDICSKADTLLVVDGTQSVGVIDIHVERAGVDVLVVSAHKWLMGPRGIGFASFSDRAMDRIEPTIVGWMSVNDPFAFNRTLDYLPDARRYEAGTPNGTGIFGLVERLTHIDEIGMEWIEARVLGLNQLVFDLASRSGIHSLYRFDRQSSSGIALLQRPGTAGTVSNELLKDNAVYASVRNGAVRVATHYFNLEKELHAAVELMSKPAA